jgi:hypothetical protein
MFISERVRDLGVVWAAWTLACNDETSLITYRGIQRF